MRAPVRAPVQRGLSQAALETLAIIAYLGPVSRPEVARIRGVAADSAVAGLLERGLIAEAGRDDGAGGAVRYRTTPLFERVFGLESLSQLPRLDDLGDDAEQIRERLASSRSSAPPINITAPVTSFTALVGCRLPVQLAGLGAFGVGSAPAVTQAGGLGTVVATRFDAQQCDDVFGALPKPVAANFTRPSDDKRRRSPRQRTMRA